MATKNTTASKSTSLIRWDEELAKMAEVAAGMEANTGGGQFFSIKGGILTWQDAPLPNNQMAVIILDSILENIYYEGRYDSETPQSPVCFAFGRDEKTMAPHQVVIDASNQQCGTSGLCSGCEMNEWASAETGRGKACRNTRRLGMIPAGIFNATGKFELIEDEEHFESATTGFMKLPVTSVKGYASFVKQVAGALKRPPFGIVTKVKVVPDPKNQFKVVFEPIMSLPDKLMSIIMKRHEEVAAVIEFPYRSGEDEEEPASKRVSKAAQKPVARRTARKY